MPLRVLDLFCGAGGASKGYADAGFSVVGVDINPQPNYPFEFHQADALTFPLDGFDLIHASPPCPYYSTITHVKGRRADHPDLIDPVRARMPPDAMYVIENVEGARSRLVSPVRLCGSSFALGVRRHRLFETNWPLRVPPCNHGSAPLRYWVYDHGTWHLSRWAPVYGHGGGKAKEVWSEAMGIDWMTKKELAQAIPPAYTHYIARRFPFRAQVPLDAPAPQGV